MAQQILPTNTFTTAKWIVSPNASDGTHTSIGAALTSASSGDDIFIRPGTYTENPALKAGVNLIGYKGDEETPNVIINGECTFSSAGTVCASNIQLQTNSNYFLSITGSAASVVYLQNCYLNSLNNSGINSASSSSSSALNITNCFGDQGTTGIAFITHSSAGALNLRYTHIFNSANNTTVSTVSAGTLAIFGCALVFPITTSGTATSNLTYVTLNLATNTTAFTVGGSGGNNALYCQFNSGSASAISVGSTLSLFKSVVSSTNTNAISGAGALTFDSISFSASSSTINTSTQSIIVQSPSEFKSVGIGASPGTTAGLTFDGSNFMNSYSTGSWTPTYNGSSAGTTTYSSQGGSYTKVGKMVVLNFNVAGSASTGTGNMIIGGLPFACGSVISIGSILYVTGPTFPTLTTSAIVQLGSGNSTMAVVAQGATTIGNVQMSNTAFSIQGTIAYVSAS